MPSVIVIGGGLAGLASAAALGEAGFDVDVFESRPFAGGRATSYVLPGDTGTIDNCQHILLRCCVNLLDFYRRMGVEDHIEFYREFVFIEPGGRRSWLRAGALPPPLHFTGSFLKLNSLGLRDRIAIARGLLALRRERTRRTDLDRITMREWLLEKKQTPLAMRRFWDQVLVSAINEEPERMAALHGFQVFWLGFLASSNSYEMGVPRVPLGELYGAKVWERLPRVRLHFRTPVEGLEVQDGRVAAVLVRGERHAADYYVSAVPVERAGALLPDLGLDFGAFSHSPITGIHLWFDREVTTLPHAALLDRTIQWMFNKDRGRYLQLVVSASRSLVETRREDIIRLAVSELTEFFPAVAQAELENAHVVKEVRATFSAVPGLEGKRPLSKTGIPNLVLAGDWTRSGWPATMEGAVRSGYLAAEAVMDAAGRPGRVLLPDIA